MNNQILVAGQLQATTELSLFPGSPLAPDRPRLRFPTSRAMVFTIMATLIFFTILMVKAFLLGVFFVPSASMQPLLNPGDRILVDLSAHPVRGSVIIFDTTGWIPGPAATQRFNLGSGPVHVALGLDPRTFYVKRVIGVGGDTVTCCDPTGQLILNGAPLAEPYLFAGNAPARTKFSVTVPSGSYWVMGDHRDDSTDSRAHLDGHSQGFVPASKVLGTLRGTLFSDGTTRDGSGT